MKRRSHISFKSTFVIAIITIFLVGGILTGSILRSFPTSLSPLQQRQPSTTPQRNYNYSSHFNIYHLYSLLPEHLRGNQGSASRLASYRTDCSSSSSSAIIPGSIYRVRFVVDKNAAPPYLVARNFVVKSKDDGFFLRGSLVYPSLNDTRRSKIDIDSEREGTTGGNFPEFVIPSNSVIELFDGNGERIDATKEEEMGTVVASFHLLFDVPLPLPLTLGEGGGERQQQSHLVTVLVQPTCWPLPELNDAQFDVPIVFDRTKNNNDVEEPLPLSCFIDFNEGDGSLNEWIQLGEVSECSARSAMTSNRHHG